MFHFLNFDYNYDYDYDYDYNYDYNSDYNYDYNYIRYLLPITCYLLPISLSSKKLHNKNRLMFQKKQYQRRAKPANR